MKFCKTCNQELPHTSFTKDKSHKDGYYSMCKACKRTSDKNRYHASCKEHSKAYHKMRRDLHQEMVVELKRAAGCYFCCETEPICLEFHHKDPTQKDFGISEARTMSRARVIEEISKCGCLC